MYDQATRPLVSKSGRRGAEVSDSSIYERTCGGSPPLAHLETYTKRYRTNSRNRHRDGIHKSRYARIRSVPMRSEITTQVVQRRCFFFSSGITAKPNANSLDVFNGSGLGTKATDGDALVQEWGAAARKDAAFYF